MSSRKPPSDAVVCRRRRAIGAVGILFGLIATTSLCGCGSSGSGAGNASESDSGGPMDLEVGTDSDPGEAATDATTACAAYATAFCLQFATCEPLTFGLEFGSQDVCRSRSADGCPDWLRAPGTAVTPESLATCGQAISAQACPDWELTPPGPCQWRGSLTAGASCEYDAQCDSSFCDVPAGWCGRCTPRIVAGGACDPVRPGCQAGLLCADLGCQDDGGTCADRWICMSPVPLGGACQSVTQCAPGLACLGGACAPALAKSEACQGGLGCAADLDCTGPAGQLTCRSVTYAGVGQTCNATTATLCSQSGTCKDANGVSAAAGICVAPAADGESCAGLLCLPPAACIAGTCQTPVPASSCP